MLHFRNFSKSYGDHPVIAINDLSLQPGTYWIRGENGSGKSTLFKSLAGLHPFDGQIQLGDSLELSKDQLEFRRRVGFSEAEPLFPPFLTAKDLVRFVGSAKKSSRQQQDEVCDRLGVSTFLEKRCETYSSGMLKKLSLALAFLGTPSLLILDEPLITLDDQTRDTLLTMIAEVDGRNDVVTLLSSHQLFDRPSLRIQGTFRIVNRTLIAE